MSSRAFITGCSGSVLTRDERTFLREARPWGLILFARNIESPDQVRTLVADFRAELGRADAPVLIDQEGGRVQRLRPPQWSAFPPAAAIGRVHARDPEAGERAAWLAGRLIGEELHALGITVDCLPMVDVRRPGAHDIVGDRAYSELPEAVATLGRAAATGLGAAGVAPVLKHIPGHGRAGADSHESLPLVDAPRDVLAACDFLPFRALRDLPAAMTAHIVYSAIDAGRPATMSPVVVGGIIRGEIGFGGLLMSDDLSMGALDGPLGGRASAALAAGCDVALHCNGRLDEMREVAAAVPALSGDGAGRADGVIGWARRMETDIAAAREEFSALLVGRCGA